MICQPTPVIIVYESKSKDSLKKVLTPELDKYIFVVVKQNTTPPSKEHHEHFI